MPISLKRRVELKSIRDQNLRHHLYNKNNLDLLFTHMAQAQEGGAPIDIVYIGNPVMDITVSDPERDIMGRYSLELGMASLVTPEQMPIYDELWAREDKLVSPGGSALNSARAQMHANAQGSVAYFGCIGNDEMGRSLTEAVTAANI